MSNAERWDHSGYNELMNEEKPNSFKKHLGKQKNLYKYKDNTTQNEKPNTMEYLDNSQNNRKNQTKKFSNFNNPKYSNDEWNNDNDKAREISSSELFDSQNGANGFKQKYKKTKKKGESDYLEGLNENRSGLNEYYNKNLKNDDKGGIQHPNNPNYSLTNSNYGYVRPVEQVSHHNTNINNSNNLNNSNYYGRNKINNQGGTNTNPGGRINTMGGNYTLTNQGFNNNINPNYQSNSTKYQPVNNQPYPYGNTISSPFNLKTSAGTSTNFNLKKQNSNSQLYNLQGSIGNSNNIQINQSPSNSTDSNSQCQKIILDDNIYPGNQEDHIMQQNHVMANDIFSSNSKKQNKTNQNINFIVENTDAHNITKNSDDKYSLPNTPTRNSGNNIQSNTTTHSTMPMSSQTPGNSVGFSPNNNADPIYIGNMNKMPNNYNFNSPIMHENFMYPNYPNPRNPVNMTNMNGPYYGMMNGINSMNINAIESNNYQTMQNNFNSNMNPNFASFPFNGPPHHMPMIPQIKGPLVNNMPQGNINPSNLQLGNKNIQPVDMYKHNNNLNIHNEDIYSNDLRGSGKKTPNSTMSNNSMQISRGINNSLVNNNTMNPNNFNPFERATGNSNAYNINPTNKKGAMQPYNNNFINNNININNLNHNQMNLNNKNFNNRKPNNNFNPNINNIVQNPMHRMKFVKSDKNLMANLENQNPYKTQSHTQNNQMDHSENPNSKILNNKIWRDSKSGNPPNVDTLTNIINNTIKGSTYGPYNKINPANSSSFTSIKEEQVQNGDNNLKNKHITILESKNQDNTIEDNKYFSSNESRNSIAEDKMKYEEKDIVLFVSVRISGKEELLGINNKEDSMITIRKFISKHRLNENLIKPISEKISNAISSIDSLLQSKIDCKDYKSLNKIKKMFDQKVEEEKVNDLDLSCFTYLGESDSFCGFNFNLSTEEAKTTEKLNMSR